MVNKGDLIKSIQHTDFKIALTLSVVTSAPSGNEALNFSFSSLATRKLSSRCMIDGNRDNELPISLEKPTIFNSQSSGGKWTTYSSFSRHSPEVQIFVSNLIV